MPDPYNPTADYATAYDALSKRIAQNFAGQRKNLNQELATRGVQTSGVSSIPSGALRASEEGERSDLAGQFALEQANTGIEDRRSAEDFSRQRELAMLGYDRQDALARRMAKSGLQSALISGGLGAVGGALAGPVGGSLAASLAPRPKPTPAINRYTSGELRGNYGQY